MVRKYKHVIGDTRQRQYSQVTLDTALEAIETGMSIRAASKVYKIPKSTLIRLKIKDISILPSMGHRPALFNHEESIIANNLAVMADWGCPLTKTDIKVTVKGYLKKCDRVVTQFKDNEPGPDWVNAFLDRYSHLLSARMCQNVNKVRANISTEVVQKFYTNIEKVLEGVPPQNIINYDETNCSDNPGNKEMVFRRGVEYPDRVMNSTKSCTSIMFAGSANGQMLPVYVVYRGGKLDTRWTEGGPLGAFYNITKNGWFDSDIFFDWVVKILVPYCKNLQGKKVVIGDNLASHLNQEVFRICEKENIQFVFLPPNATHLMQPLDVTFFRPLKGVWRNVLTEWKKTFGKNLALLPREWFPRLLSSAIEQLDSTGSLTSNLVSGFAACGIEPLNPRRVLDKLERTNTNNLEDTKLFVADSLIEKLVEMRSPPPPSTRRKRFFLEPGKSHIDATIQSPDGVNDGASTSCSTAPVSKKTCRRNLKAVLISESDDTSDDDDSDEEVTVLIDDDHTQEALTTDTFDDDTVIIKDDFLAMRAELQCKSGNKFKYFMARLVNVIHDNGDDGEVVTVDSMRKSEYSKNVPEFVFPPQQNIEIVRRGDVVAKLEVESQNRSKYKFKDLQRLPIALNLWV